MAELIQTADWAVLHWIRDTLRCGFLDFLMPKLTALGNVGAVWLLAALLLLCSRRYRRYGAILLGALAAGALLGNLCLKPLVARARPCWLEGAALLIGIPADYSFPSGHTLASVIGAVVLTAADRRFGWAAIPVAVLIAFSRLYLYVHFPSDVLAAAVLGAAVGAAALAAGRRLPALRRKRAARRGESG